MSEEFDDTFDENVINDDDLFDDNDFEIDDFDTSSRSPSPTVKSLSTKFVEGTGSGIIKGITKEMWKQFGKLIFRAKDGNVTKINVKNGMYN